MDLSGSVLHSCSGDTNCFWISVSLVNSNLSFLLSSSIAISGNVADFLQKSVAMDDHKWHYDFHKVTKAVEQAIHQTTCTAWHNSGEPGSHSSILLCIHPSRILIWLSLVGRGCGGQVKYLAKFIQSNNFEALHQSFSCSGAALSFLELVCLYGYSLSIYVPVSILWLIQVPWMETCWLINTCLTGILVAMAVCAARSWPLWCCTFHSTLACCQVNQMLSIKKSLYVAGMEHPREHG